MFTSSALSGNDAALFQPASNGTTSADAGQATHTSSSRAQATFPLSMATPGQLLRVAALRGSGMDRRMTEIGLNVGAEIRVVQQQGGGLVVQRGESRYALGAGLAHRVLVAAV
ncbi:FeoA family protein [Rhodoferax fermentans]|uniref:FeoA family protein n=1 Tax=Rhodoferax fermentans TaxID=28066 RepID=UPI0009922BA5|nr:FeoA family protein [Rhodoferax fermentans]MBK1685862.1 ferrous iron transport protein A [Rhodoferax fermentans]